MGKRYDVLFFIHFKAIVSVGKLMWYKRNKPL